MGAYRAGAWQKAVHSLPRELRPGVDPASGSCRAAPRTAGGSTESQPPASPDGQPHLRPPACSRSCHRGLSALGNATSLGPICLGSNAKVAVMPASRRKRKGGPGDANRTRTAEDTRVVPPLVPPGPTTDVASLPQPGLLERQVGLLNTALEATTCSRRDHPESHASAVAWDHG